MPTVKPIIIVVDDDPAVRDSLKFSLELEGLTVHTCDSGKSLLDHPQLKQAGCVVLDYKMPEMDGFEVLAACTRASWVPTARANALFGSVAVFAVLWFPGLNDALVDLVYTLFSLVLPVAAGGSFAEPAARRAPHDQLVGR